MVLRLAQPERQALIAAGQAVPFVAMGGLIMREWVVVNEPQRIADDTLGELLEAARRVSSLLQGEGGYDASGWETLRDVSSVGH